MPEPTDEMVSHGGAVPTLHPTIAQAAAPAPSTGLSRLLELIRPYREIAALLSGLLVVVSGGVAWVVAHFATQLELHYVECRVTNNLLTQLLPIHMEEFAEKIDWRSAQIRVLAQHGGGTPDSIKTIVDLTEQVNSLTQQQNEADAKFQKEIDDISKRCISETPSVGEKS